MRFEGHYSIDQDVEGYYPLIKARLLGAVAAWLRQGQLTAMELQEVLAAASTAPPVKVVKKPVKVTKKVTKGAKT